MTSIQDVRGWQALVDDKEVPLLGRPGFWRPGVRLLLLACSVPGLTGCLDYRDQGDGWAKHPDGIVHPIADSLLSATTDVPVFEVSADSPADPNAQSYLEELANFPEGGAFGRFDGPTDSVLGDLVDAAVLSNGDIAVLDENYSTVRLFSSVLEPLGILGGPGEGPGELEYPVAIVEQPPGWISVVDLGGPHFERFGLSSSAESTTRLSIPIYSLSDACSIGFKTFVVGTNVEFDFENRTSTMLSSDRVHELTQGGGLARSFSVPYAFLRDRTVGGVYGEGFLACGSTQLGERIWAAYSTLGEVHSFHDSGVLRWIVKLTDFHYPNQIQTPTSMGVDPEQTDLVELISNATLLSDALLSVQVTSIRREEGAGPETTYRTYLLEPETGRFLGAFEGAHQVLDGGDGKAILYRPIPYPQISVVQVGIDQS